MTVNIYLAGPIAECDNGEANDWREYVSEKFRLFGVKGISPLRCEPITGTRYAGPLELQHTDLKFGTPRAISSKNFMDVQRCDMTFAYLPKSLNERRPSYGTISEIGWSNALQKPVAIITDDPYIANHPVVTVRGWVLPTLDEGVELVRGLFGDYAKPWGLK